SSSRHPPAARSIGATASSSAGRRTASRRPTGGCFPRTKIRSSTWSREAEPPSACPPAPSGRGSAGRQSRSLSLGEDGRGRGIVDALHLGFVGGQPALEILDEAENVAERAAPDDLLEG